MTSEVSTAVSKYVQCDAEWMRIVLMVVRRCVSHARAPSAAS